MTTEIQMTSDVLWTDTITVSNTAPSPLLASKPKVKNKILIRADDDNDSGDVVWVTYVSDGSSTNKSFPLPAGKEIEVRVEDPRLVLIFKTGAGNPDVNVLGN